MLPYIHARKALPQQMWRSLTSIYAAFEYAAGILGASTDECMYQIKQYGLAARDLVSF